MSKKRKIIMIVIFIIMIGVLGGVGYYYWYNNTHFVTTEDARVTGNLIKISPQISGKLLEFNVEEGDSISQDQIVGRQEMPSTIADSNVEQTVIRSPMTGIVVKKYANIGEIEAAGQTLAMIIDPKKLYISANIEETKLGKVKQGQAVDITIDQIEGKVFTGKVSYVGKASNSAFSILPTSTSGTFTKVVQRVPVKIQLDKADDQLLPGTNAIIKIHIK